MKQTHMNRFPHWFTRTLFAVFTVIIVSFNVSAHDFETEGIYYKITSTSSKTVGVACSGTFGTSVANEYIHWVHAGRLHRVPLDHSPKRLLRFWNVRMALSRSMYLNPGQNTSVK